MAMFAQQLPRGPWRTRFAPAPTGYMHLGHVVNALHVWGIARALGGTIVLRIEDHDRTRCRPEFETALLDDLTWLGLDADDGTINSYAQHPHAYRQSDNSARYAAALAQLETAGLVYACNCTRLDIAHHSLCATREGGEELRYPGTCRDRHVPYASTPARRVRIGSGCETFDDIIRGPQLQDPSADCGDVLIRDRNGNWTYQFAVTVDDMAQSIGVIIRGVDLLSSSGRQRHMARLLGHARMPLLMHHPLLVHADGAKLSKASGDTSLAERRRDGATPSELFGEAALRSGLIATYRPIDVAELPLLFL